MSQTLDLSDFTLDNPRIQPEIQSAEGRGKERQTYTSRVVCETTILSLCPRDAPLFELDHVAGPGGSLDENQEQLINKPPASGRIRRLRGFQHKYTNTVGFYG
jgi:hypothetical protein